MQIAVLLLMAIPRLAHGQESVTGTSTEDGSPSWSWPLDVAGARFAMRAGMLAPEEPGEPLTSVSIEALARWRAMRASIDLAICRAVALGVDPVIGAHATLGWSGAPIEPLLDMHVDWATAAAQPSVRVGPALAALPGNAQSLVAIASYGTAAGELRFDLIYAMDLQVGD